jgi:prepilin signal peptidase PulO-like enzyme (type II secretory pathway)
LRVGLEKKIQEAGRTDLQPDVASLAMTPVLAMVLIKLSLVDLRERRLPEWLTLPLAAAGLVLAAWRTGEVPTLELIGAGCGFLLFWALGEAHYRIRGNEGLGLGDAKLLGAAGAWLGWRDLPLVVLIAALGALVAVLTGRHQQREIPFGPWLAAAFMLVWLARLLQALGESPKLSLC